MLWLKAFHLIFMVTWFAALFYLPRLFVYHAQCDDEPGRTRFRVMERKLLWGIATPGAVLTLIFGFATLTYRPDLLGADWMQLKLALIGMLIAYHSFCIHLTGQFAREQNRHSHVWYRWFNEIPVIFLIAIILLSVLRPAWL